jgi:hypothetical protein
MSWYIAVVGKPVGVAREFAAQAERNKCAEPEESIKAGAVALVQKALEGFGEGYAVQLTASGSQYVDAGVVRSNSLKIDLQPLSGFVDE